MGNFTQSGINSMDNPPERKLCFGFPCEKTVNAIISFTEKLVLRTINLRDDFTYNHSFIVGAFSGKLLTHYRAATDLDMTQIKTSIGIDKHLIYAGITHDVGKISWPDSLLKGKPIPRNKEKKYTKYIEEHPEEGAKAIYHSFLELKINLKEDDLIWILGILYHHKDYKKNTSKYDYSAIKDSSLQSFVRVYADRIFSPKLSKEASDIEPVRVMIGILRIVDSLHAMLCEDNRRYREEGVATWDEAMEKIENGVEEGKYHPDIADTLRNNKKPLEAFYDQIRRIPWKKENTT